VNFVELTSKIANMNALTSDEYANVLTWLLQYRSEAVELESVRYNAMRSALNEADAKISNLEAALAEVHSQAKVMVVIDWNTLFEEGKRFLLRKIDFVKFVRNSGVVTFSNGATLGLYEAKIIAELVMCYYEVMPMPQTLRSEIIKVIGQNSTREDVRTSVTQFLNQVCPGVEVVYSGVWG